MPQIRITDSQGRAINSRNVNRKVFQRITDRGFFNPMKPAYDGVNNVYTPHQLREDSYKRLETDVRDCCSTCHCCLLILLVTYS